MDDSTSAGSGNSPSDHGDASKSSQSSEHSAGASSTSMIQEAPTDILGIVKRLGPGLIVAGSIVGSGELIATTSTGAQAGFWLLWLIIIGCVIKVFVQVEFGRYAISSGKTTMRALSEVPGPRIKNRGNWLIWYWFAMFLASIAQLGGIVGGVGQALSISAPLTRYASDYNQFADAETQLIVHHSEVRPAWDRSEFIKSAEDGDWETPLDRDASTNIYLLEMTSMQLRASLMELGDTGGDGDSTENDEALLSAEALEGILDRTEERLSTVDENRAFAELLWLAYEQYVVLIPERDRLRDEIESATGDATNEIRDELRSLEQEIASIERLMDGRAAEIDAVEFLDVYRLTRTEHEIAAPLDDKIWAALIAALTAAILFHGRFGLIQSFSTAMVASFTAITIVNLFLLQSNPTWGVSMGDIIDGMRFRLPPSDDGDSRALITALQTFGIIGVGATELIVYPYWCLEKGYARFTGPRSESPEWINRVHGWLRVMKWDAWCSMVIYTFATIAFYLLGAAVLGRSGLEPAGPQLIRYLAVMYEPVFGSTARLLFLFGAFAVLYSTFFVANASHARVFSDALRVLGVTPNGEDFYRRIVRWLSALFPMLCFTVYFFFPTPTKLVLLSGLMQAVMLPMLATAALYFRYRRIDKRLQPSKVWDVFLWLSALGMLVAGGWAGWSKIKDVFAQIFGG